LQYNPIDAGSSVIYHTSSSSSEGGSELRHSKTNALVPGKQRLPLAASDPADLARSRIEFP
jgi:hypothetical protein